MKFGFEAKTYAALTWILTAAILLTSCTSAPPGSGLVPDDQTVPNVDRTVAVGRSDLTPIISLDSIVNSAVNFDITAPINGQFRQSVKGEMSVTDESGKVHKMELPSLVTNVVHIVKDGAFVSRGLPVARATYTGFVMSAQISGSDLLRLQTSPDSARAQITGGGAPFDCVMLDPLSSSPEVPQDANRSIYCVIPPEQQAMVGLSGIMALRFPSEKNALVLPVEAVGGTTKTGLVYLLDGKEVVERKVKLGKTDGLQIVITDGLIEGDVVEIPSPSILK